MDPVICHECGEPTTAPVTDGYNPEQYCKECADGLAEEAECNGNPESYYGCSR